MALIAGKNSLPGAGLLGALDGKRTAFIFLGLALFLAAYYAPALPAAHGLGGASFPLTREGQAALALYLLATVWWVADVVPIGVTGVAIGLLQILASIRPARAALTDFLDPAIWFVLGSLIIGIAFTKTGLTRRVAYSMLVLAGERTSVILLGCFLAIAALTLAMAHTAVTATVYPLLLAVHSLYSEKPQPTRFGKGLFIGMAFAAGAGSVVTLFGSARAAVTLGFFREVTGREVGFYEVAYYMLPLGAVMIVVIWAFLLVLFPPEHAAIPGLGERAKRLRGSLGPLSRAELTVLAVVVSAALLLGFGELVPAWCTLDKSAVVLAAAVLLFLLKTLSLDDLEGTPLNIILFFGGAMSIGLCLWQTGAAAWLAMNLLAVLGELPSFAFVMGFAVAVMIMVNVIMNIAVIALALPVALAAAPGLGASPEVVLYSCLAAAGMPFLLLIGAAPNAIAFGSNQFTPRQFFWAGVPVSAAFIIILGLFVRFVWPAMGMPVSGG